MGVKPGINPRNGTHPLVFLLFKQMKDKGWGVEKMALVSGVSRNTILRWPRNFKPKLHDLEACLNALGLRLIAVETKQEHQE